MTNEKIKEIDNYCSLCMDINCEGCEYQDIHFRNLPYYKPKNKNKMKTGIELIAEERQRQIDVEGYTAQHDSQHEVSEFLSAAKSYMDSAYLSITSEQIDNSTRWQTIKDSFPWDKKYFKPTTPLRDLAKAGALIAAAIDRLQIED